MELSNCDEESCCPAPPANGEKQSAEEMNSPLVAVIGSFRQHFDEIRDAVRRLQSVGAHVNTPRGTVIMEPGVEFVRFETDPPHWTNEDIQTVTMHRIFRADFVIVVCVGGYLGRTTCYEVGRVIGANRPIYFSERPKDIPLLIPETHIVDINKLADLISARAFRPTPLFSTDFSKTAHLERLLATGPPLSDLEIASQL